jgi:hypothetical protein
MNNEWDVFILGLIFGLVAGSTFGYWAHGHNLKVRAEENRVKIMISQPMKGRTEEEIRAERAVVVADLQEQGHEVIDTVFDLGPDIRPETRPLKYFAKSIEAMADVDAVYFMSGWEAARGCRCERLIAIEYGKQILDSAGVGFN